MIRKAAIEYIAKKIGTSTIIAANGYVSRDLFETCDKSSNFYMLGSMGLASSIALGVALKNPKKRIFIFDGDGNILMNLGSLTTIGTLKPRNLVHVVFDNGSHESTGGQPTNTKTIQIDNIAKASNYRVSRVTTKSKLEKILKKIDVITGPFMILIKVKQSKQRSKRVKLNPEKIRQGFMYSLNFNDLHKI